MESLANAVNTASTLKYIVQAEATRPDKRVLSADEAAEAQVAKDEAMAKLRSTRISVQKALKSIRTKKAARQATKGKGKGGKAMAELRKTAEESMEATRSALALGAPVVPNATVLSEAVSAAAAAIPFPGKIPTKLPTKLPGFPTTKPAIPTKPIPTKPVAPKVLDENVMAMVKGLFPLEKDDEGIQPAVTTVEEMVQEIQPIIDIFDELLTKPSLVNHNASLNRVPVLGLKNGQIMYLSTELDGQGGTHEVWKTFGSLPSGAQLPQPVANGSSTYYPGVHFFPFEGNLYFAIGKKLWFKTQKPKADDTIKDSVNDWPKLFHNTWQLAGSNVFPESNLRNIIPFYRVDAIGQEKPFSLLLLDSQGRLQFLKEDVLNDQSTWGIASWVGSGPVPVWEHMAYWNDLVVAVFSQGGRTFSDHLALDFVISGENKVSRVEFKPSSDLERAPIQPITELTATHVGPVGVVNGTLRQRRVYEPPTDEANDQGNFGEPVPWESWVAQDGVVNLGVASPGIFLDLNTLIRALKSRYIETQLSILPAMRRMRSFAVIHKSYLDFLTDAAIKFKAGELTQEEEIEQGKDFLDHAQLWLRLVGASIESQFDTVVLMGREMEDVSNQLETQVASLNIELTKLESQLADTEDALSQAEKTFWGLLGATLAIVALAIIGTLAVVLSGGTLAPAVIALAVVIMGGLFVAGAVTAAQANADRKDLIEAKASYKSQIDQVNISIDELTDLSGSFNDLQGRYEVLNIFFGRLQQASNTIDDLLDPVAQEAAIVILSYWSKEFNRNAVYGQINDLLNYTTLYMDTLAGQGITLNTSSAVAASRSALAMSADVPAPTSTEDHLDDFSKGANAALSNGDSKAYIAGLRQIVKSDATAAVQVDLSKSLPGVIIPVLKAKPASLSLDRLKNSTAIWSAGNSKPISTPKPLPSGVTAIILGKSSGEMQIKNSVKVAGEAVVKMLNKTAKTCDTVQELLGKYEEAEANDTLDDMAPTSEKYLMGAYDTCGEALKHAAEANNAFVDVNHKVTDYQQGLQRDMNSAGIQAKNAREVANDETGDVPKHIPWHVYLGGAVAVTAYIVKKRNDIKKELDRTLDRLNRQIKDLKSKVDSGTIFEGDSLTWTELVRTVSTMLVQIHTTVYTIRDIITADPIRYKDLMSEQWAEISQTAKDILSILHSQGVGVSEPSLRTFSVQSRRKERAISSEAVTTQLIEALTPDGSLTSELSSQSLNMTKFFNNIESAINHPNIEHIMATWEGTDGNPGPQSMLDLTLTIRSRVADLAATEYSSVRRINSMALISRSILQVYKDGDLNLAEATENIKFMVDLAASSAENTNNKFNVLTQDWKEIVDQVKANIASLIAQISALDDQIDDAEDQLDSAKKRLIAELVVGIIVTAASAAVLGFFLGPPGAELGVAVGAELSILLTVSILDGLSIKETKDLIRSLKASRKTLQETLDQIETVSPYIEGSALNMRSLKDDLDRMLDDIIEVEENLPLIEGGAIDPDDVDKMIDAWNGVQVGAISWMDGVAAQGIVP